MDEELEYVDGMLKADDGTLWPTIQEKSDLVTFHERPRRPDMEYLRDCLKRPGGVDHVELKDALDYIEWLEKERVR